MPRGRVHGTVSASDAQSRGPGFEFCSDLHLDLFCGSSAFKCEVTLVNENLVCLPAASWNSQQCYVLFVQLFARHQYPLCYKHCRGQTNVFILFSFFTLFMDKRNLNNNFATSGYMI